MVTNPYAKKASNASHGGGGTVVNSETSNSINESTIAISSQNRQLPLRSNQTNSNNASIGTSVEVNRAAQQQQQQEHLESLLLPVPKYTTFSQAFDDDEYDIGSSRPQHENDGATLSTTTMTNINNNDNVIIPTNSTTDAIPQPVNTTDANVDSHDKTTTGSSLLKTDRDYHILQQQPHVLYVSTKQHGNPILQYIRNVPYTYTRMVPDYIFSSTFCAIYLSCKYHILYRNYIHTRIAELKTDFTKRILFVYVDMDDTDKVLLELNILAVKHNFTLILGWSEEEMARYIETCKVLHNRDASSIQKNKDSNHMTVVDQITDVLTSCKAINKTDAASLITQFHTVRNIITATTDELSMITGLGPIKVQRIHDTFHKPFSSKLAKQRREQQHQNDVDEKKTTATSLENENYIDTEN